MKYSSISLLFFAILFSCSSPNQEEAQNQWLDLDESMGLWELKNGSADYLFKDGVVTGTTVLGSPNSFLCTKKDYSDFILEYEVMVDTAINSGVQIRSQSLPEYNNGRVHGYQIEVDPSERAWSGGIYDEARRGWLYNLEENESGRKAFKNLQWNHYRVEAVANQFRVWVNGISTANLQDDMTAEGFIGLQVHSIRDSSQVGREIKWRNIQILENPSEKDLKNDPGIAELLIIEPETDSNSDSQSTN